MSSSGAVESMYDLDELPDLTAVIDKFDDVWQYRGGLWCSYETAPHGSERLFNKFSPLRVLYRPDLPFTPQLGTDFEYGAAAHFVSSGSWWKTIPCGSLENARLYVTEANFDEKLQKNAAFPAHWSIVRRTHPVLAIGEWEPLP